MMWKRSEVWSRASSTAFMQIVIKIHNRLFSKGEGANSVHEVVPK